jgi:hypothetical protein
MPNFVDGLNNEIRSPQQCRVKLKQNMDVGICMFYAFQHIVTLDVDKHPKSRALWKEG